jgi:hypothetical protein
MPFHSVPVWHQIKYLCEDSVSDSVSKSTVTVDSIHVQPSTTNNYGHMVPGHFNTTLVNEGTGGNTRTEDRPLYHCYN